MKNYEDRFMFHAGAVPFGVRFPALPGAETRAATALASIGGRATAEEVRCVLDGGFVRFEAAGSEVVGDELPPKRKGTTVFRTRATSWIKRLRIGGLLEIGDLSVMLESHYEMRDREPAHEPSFLRLSTKGRGLKVCGSVWKAGASSQLGWINGLETYERVLKERAGAKKAGWRDQRMRQVYCASRTRNGKRRLVPASDPAALQSPDAISVFGLTPPALKPGRVIVNPRSGNLETPERCEPAVGGYFLEWPGKRADIRPSVRFYFGEYVVSKGYRRFTAVRMVITRSPPSQLVIGEVSLNGSKVP